MERKKHIINLGNYTASRSSDAVAINASTAGDSSKTDGRQPNIATTSPPRYNFRRRAIAPNYNSSPTRKTPKLHGFGVNDLSESKEALENVMNGGFNNSMLNVGSCNYLSYVLIIDILSDCENEDGDQFSDGN